MNCMNGKINIIFGFFYLATTAVLGPVVLVPGKGANFQAMAVTAKAVEEVKAAVGSGFTGIEKPSTVIAPAVVGIMEHLQNEGKLRFIASAAHAHGNLEALLNIAVGVVLLLLSIPANYKKLIGLLFITGAVFHSGMLYLSAVFGQAWTSNFTPIGAYALIAGLILMGFASVVGIKGGIKRECLDS